MNTFTILFVTAVFLPLVVADGMDVIIINPLNDTTASANVLDPETEAPTKAEESDYEALQKCENTEDEDICEDIEGCDWVQNMCMFHEPIGDCERFRPEERCIENAECEWIQDPPRDSRSEPPDGMCHPMCERFTSEEECHGKCTWLQDPPRDSRSEPPNGTCRYTQELEKGRGNCAVDGFIIPSKSVCNNVKGCSWKKNGCSVALSHVECKAITKRTKCTNAGCGFQMKKKKKECYGRWEKKFLSSLKKVEAEIAKQKIEDEYGIGTFNVVLKWPGQKSGSRSNASNQITLKLTKNGKVRKAIIR
mmetsp:Transcript_2870/g.6368  ORF Transcript_2870/g.6368 Transcript_2870/m.6368 type:complete len:306 (+) Transcript_2870:266-1183(+)